MQWLGKTDASAQILDASDLARFSGHARHGAELALWCRRLGIGTPDAASRGPAPFLAELAGEWAAAGSGWGEMGLPYHRTLTLAFSDDPGAMSEAVVEATRLGASTTADCIRARLRELGHSVGRGPARATLVNPGTLTRRQVEVVALLANGLSNREIADRMFISPKTVDHHVSAILTRLGVKDRQSAGEWAIAQGLATSG
jgi:DNA-binding CsgD family transcriptional regulator